MTQTTSEQLNACRLAYGLLWHVTTDNKNVHEARKVLLAWLNDKDQQKIGIDEARKHIKNNLPEHRPHDPYLDGP